MFKTISCLLFCVLVSIGVSAQTERHKNDKAEVNIEEIYLARDNGRGKADEKQRVDKFIATDNPLHCVVILDSVKPVTVAMTLYAAHVEGVKKDTKVIGATMDTNGAQNKVDFDVSLPRDWLVGAYRFDITINGKPAGSKTFRIEKER